MTDTSNGGPPDLPLTAKTKLECIRGIIERMDLTSPQKCIGVGIVLSADREWTAEVNTASLQQFASAKDRETVFRATKALDQKAIISKANVRGQGGKYTVMPPSILEAIIEAYGELKSGQAKPDGGSDPLPTSNAVRSEPTSLSKPVGSGPTSRAPAPAQIEFPSGINNTLESKGKSPLSPQYDEPRLSLENGRLMLFNGYRQLWLDKFGGDEERLDLALIDAAGAVQNQNPIAMERQVSRRLAQIAGDKLDRDQRYAKAAKANAKTAPKEPALAKLSRQVDQVFDRQFPDTTPKPMRLTNER